MEIAIPNLGVLLLKIPQTNGTGRKIGCPEGGIGNRKKTHRIKIGQNRTFQKEGRFVGIELGTGKVNQKMNLTITGITILNLGVLLLEIPQTNGTGRKIGRPEGGIGHRKKSEKNGKCRPIIHN